MKMRENITFSLQSIYSKNTCLSKKDEKLIISSVLVRCQKLSRDADQVRLECILSKLSLKYY